MNTISLEDCFFYATIDLPKYGVQKGAWDLRGKESDYLGCIDFASKTVLEIGTANGALAFWMESQGATVTAFDLSPAHDWDIVPHPDMEATRTERKKHIQKLNNAFRFSKDLLGKKAMLEHGVVYNLHYPEKSFDIVTICSVLLHLQNPFGAIIEAAKVCREILVITDIYPGHANDMPTQHFFENIPAALFVPALYAGAWDAWLHLSPPIVSVLLQRLGFAKIEFTKHTHFTRDNQYICGR
jgi:2-polyprenyl-3-methyl-5-hydroxy-6-metoxy-1,4-benzoquinol methylase